MKIFKHTSMINKQLNATSFFSIVLIIAFLFSCNDSKISAGKEDAIKEIAMEDLNVELPLDLPQISYAYGRVIGRRASGQAGGQINPNQFLNAFYRAKNDPSIELQAVSDKIYQLRQQQGRSPEVANLMNEQMGLYLGAMDRANPMLKRLDVVKFSEGFNDVIGGSDGININADSIYQKAVEDYNRALGMKFMAENSKREGVQITATGLQYRVIKEGEGDKPNSSNEVTVHYTGQLISGDVFDSSLKNGKPISFNLGGVIAGWTEGLQLMSPGSKYRFYIPQELAYGSQGMSKIPPYSALIFDVELISFK